MVAWRGPRLGGLVRWVRVRYDSPMRVLHLDPEPFHTLGFNAALPGGSRGGASLPFLTATVDELPADLEALVVASDLQGRVGARLLGVAVAEELLLLGDLGLVPPASAVGVLLAGDLYAAPGADVRGASGEVSEVWDAFALSFRWVVGVLGNHDLLGGPPARAVLDGDVVLRDGLRIGGVSGIVGKPTKPRRKTEAAFREALARVAQVSDVVVLHESPEVPEHGLRGQAAVRDELDTRARAGATPLVVSGHCHWPVALVELATGLQLLNVDGRVVVLARA